MCVSQTHGMIDIHYERLIKNIGLSFLLGVSKDTIYVHRSKDNETTQHHQNGECIRCWIKGFASLVTWSHGQKCGKPWSTNK